MLQRLNQGSESAVKKSTIATPVPSGCGRDLIHSLRGVDDRHALGLRARAAR
jgi:hypothetical protein